MLLSLLVATLAAMGELDTALYYADRAVEVSPSSPGPRANRARVHILARRPTEAIADLRGELAINPSADDTRAAISQLLASLNRLDEALAVLDDAPARAGTPGRFADARAGVLLSLGCADEALAIHRPLLQLDPGNPAVAERAANAAIYALNTSPAEIKEFATRFGRLISTRLPVARSPFANRPDPDRRLRIAFVSGDFRDHAIMRFFEPLATSYDKQQLEFRCYMTMPAEDACTARVRAAVDHFENVSKLPIPALAARLREHQIDIAVDLSGRTVGHRMECFHLRPAPVQLTWFGQPVTSGLSALDYRIVDSCTDPVGTESHNVERLLRLDPCGFTFAPVPESPDVQPPPSQREGSPTHGAITFGCYNNLTKMNDATFALWARILQAVPGATLRLRHTGFASPGVCDQILRRFAAQGLGTQAASRIVIHGPTDNAKLMLSEYHKVDIALDTFPYSGMTTTCEAMWMGVPVVGLAMDRSASRYTLSILTSCGLGDLVASTPDDYVRIAVDLASSPARLTQLRASLRNSFSASVGDAPAFAHRFNSAMRAVWREWCAVHAARG